METCIPNKGFIGKWFNPHPFNAKEHLAIVMSVRPTIPKKISSSNASSASNQTSDYLCVFSMSSSASAAALATEVLAAQKLYYGVVPNSAVAVLLLFSSQLLGYGMAGVLRKSLVYPTKMLWPSVLPLSSLIETLHRERNEMKKRFRFFCMYLLSLLPFAPSI